MTSTMKTVALRTQGEINQCGSDGETNLNIIKFAERRKTDSKRRSNEERKNQNKNYITRMKIERIAFDFHHFFGMYQNVDRLFPFNFFQVPFQLAGWYVMALYAAYTERRLMVGEFPRNRNRIRRVRAIPLNSSQYGE